MTDGITTGSVHHVALTVTDVERSVAFYTTVLNFQVLAPIGPRVLLRNSTMVLALGPAPHQPLRDDRFDDRAVDGQHGCQLTVRARVTGRGGAHRVTGVISG